MKIKITRNKKEYNQYKVEMVLTEGAIRTIKTALSMYAENGSVIAQDLLNFFNEEMNKAGLSTF